MSSLLEKAAADAEKIETEAIHELCRNFGVTVAESLDLRHSISLLQTEGVRSKVLSRN